jgi:Na+-translocating ferredoxin:NAD+ oxidoreductase RNF subunit RnfB
MNVILITAIFAFALAFILGIALGFFKKLFYVPVDEKVSAIRAVLPGANCGACGYPGCDGFAAAVAAGKAPSNGCAAGGAKVAGSVAAITGGSADVTPVMAVLACRGSREHAPLKGEYAGIQTCRGGKLSAGGTKLCVWGCMGFGDCVKACKFDALSIGPEGLPVIDRSKCTGCKACSQECPQKLIRMVDKTVDEAAPFVYCGNRNTNKPQVRKTCTAGCIKCELCVKNCPQGALTMVNGIPEVDYAKCNACGTCYGKCPTKAIEAITPQKALATKAA